MRNSLDNYTQQFSRRRNLRASQNMTAQNIKTDKKSRKCRINILRSAR